MNDLNYSTRLVAQYFRTRLGQKVYIGEIARAYNMSARTVQAAIAELRENGWQFETKRGRGGYTRCIGMRLKLPVEIARE